MTAADPAIIHSLGTDLLGCITQAMSDTGLDLPNYMYVSAGLPAMDDCCGGWLTVRPVRLYQSGTFPVDADYTGGACIEGLMAVTYNAQFALCVPGPDDSGRPPSTESLDLAGYHASVYMLAMFRGMACCVGEWIAEGLDAVVGAMTEDGEPQGLCASYTGAVSVSLEDCPCPEALVPIVTPLPR
jgi:hypothetical protein